MSRLARIGLVGVGAFVVLAAIAIVVGGLVADRLWFGSLGFAGVYDRVLATKVSLFVGFGAVLGVAVSANVVLGYALRPLYIHAPEMGGLGRLRVLLAPKHRWTIAVLAVVLGLIAGRSAAAQWQTFLMWRYGGSFGIVDPHFHHDVGFYVFVLPWWHFALDFVMVTLILCLVAATLAHYLYGGLRLQPGERHLTRAAGLHLALLGAAILLVKGVQSWLARYSELVHTGPNFTGMSYVGDHAVLPGQAMLTWMAVVCAVVIVVAAWRSQWITSTVALGLYVLAILVVAVVWPAALRSASVDGRVVTAEGVYVVDNIAATREAYDLGSTVTDVAKVSEPAARQVAEASQQIAAVRTDTQEPDPSLGVQGRLNIGYYEVGGKLTQLLMSVQNVRGVSTLEVAYAAPTAGESSGWWTSQQVRSRLGLASTQVPITPVTSGYEVTSKTGANAPEGYSLASSWARTAAAIRYADPDLLGASGRLTDLRQPLQRVQKLAPWLTLDSDVYPAVADGRVVWILDGYTTSASYPDSQMVSLDASTATDMSPRPTYGSGVDEVNYLRDSVKVVVDATTGAVTFYAWDEQDPILKAMSRAFPGMIKPKETMSPQLASAMRYPSLMFDVQRSLLATYRDTNPAGFLKDQSPWIPASDSEDTAVMAASLRGAAVDANGALTPTLTATYTDASGALTTAYVTASSDPASPDFGQLVLHVLPDSPTVAGAAVVERRFQSDARVEALVKKIGTPHWGALITLPIAGGLLQAQCIDGANVQPGQVKAWVATVGGEVGFGPTLLAAIQDSLAVPGGPASETAADLVRQADAVLAAASTALAHGDRAIYDADVAKAKALLDRALLDPSLQAGQK